MNKKTLITLVILISVISVTFKIYGHKNKCVSNKHEQIKALTLKDAYNVALVKITTLDSNSKLYFITSVDEPDSNTSCGLDGKRRYWNFIFNVPKANKQFIITIHDGQVVNYNTSKNPLDENDLIDLTQLKVDNTDAVKKAILEYNLKPGLSWARGYNFVLAKIDGKIILTVVGNDKDGNFSRININSTTGDIVSAIHKISTGGGLFRNNSQLPIFQSQTTILTGASYSDKNGTIGVWGYENTDNSNVLPILSLTEDGGNT
ncbi:hypothetical protein [Clostridium tetani]|uniref:hypothetical protein n=1 Tax=Clostridium tetani TaxID=1513 RepID=UPI00068B1A0F|nr:hypothetical protein [Clostridium tetani]SUY65468.1 Uncharacterised protein [Clostridium tetani]